MNLNAENKNYFFAFGLFIIAVYKLNIDIWHLNLFLDIFSVCELSHL